MNNMGVNKMQGRILFKQMKVINNAGSEGNGKAAVVVTRSAATWINFRSNIAGIVKIMTMSPLRVGYFEQLRRTPFWIMIEAIRVNKLNHNGFRKYDELVSKIIRTYDEECNAFKVGGKHVKIGKREIRLLFGIQCGITRLDLSPCQRLVSDFVQRRCHNAVRVSSKLVKTLFEEAVRGRSRVDEEDTVKLPVLYVCGKLFFSNSGETISWAFVRYIDDLHHIRTYDWTGAILQTLMGSIKDFYRTPEKVTGCVVALLY
ncbi:hypothetical protein ACSBR2_035664 [Camellia fascicularis]